MSYCPKCHYKLKLTDWKPECPKCGTNLMFYGFADRFFEEAKYAEMDLAQARVSFAKAKAAFIGGKLQIARFVSVILPIVALLASFGTLSISLPLFSKDISVSAIGVYGLFTDGTFGVLLPFRGSAIIGASASSFTVALAAYALLAVLVICVLLTQLLCFTNVKRTTVALIILSALGVVASAATYILVHRVPDSGSLITFTPSYIGLVACAAAFVVVLFLNAIIAKKGIQVPFKEGDLYRVETLKHLKHGDITLNDLPLPVFETEAERLEREAKIEKTAEEIAEAKKKGDAEHE